MVRAALGLPALGMSEEISNCLEQAWSPDPDWPPFGPAQDLLGCVSSLAIIPLAPEMVSLLSLISAREGMATRFEESDDLVQLMAVPAISYWRNPDSAQTSTDSILEEEKHWYLRIYILGYLLLHRLYWPKKKKKKETT